MSLIPRITELHEELTACRRDLHAHPQTAFEETYASDVIATRMEEAGLAIHRGLATTGVVGTLEGSKPAQGNLKAIGLRADIDALDITEANDVAWKSTNPGKMHACGHDGHTTMLLGAMKYLAETRNFAGTVQFIFQPAEENEGGGRVMVEEGLFEKFPVDAVFGMHNWPGVDVGKFAISSGAMMAAFDVFEIKIQGVGSHAAMPHKGVDPVLTASQVVAALQSIASRNVDPLEQVVISVTQIHGGETWNVIPTEVILRGTVRTFRAEVQDAVEPAMKRVIDGVCSAMGATGQLHYERRYPATINTEQEAAWSAEVADTIVSPANVDRNPQPSMGGEDFSFMLKERPGSYIWIGNGPTDGDCMLHNPRYDFNDDILPIGASYWARLVETLLAG